MPIPNYGVLKGRPIRRILGTDRSAHYQIRVIDEDTDYRVAVNVKSKQSPSELEYLVDEDFQHPIVGGLAALPRGVKRLTRSPGGLSLDYIRANLLDRTRMRPLPVNLPGPDNDLNEKLDRYVERAIGDEEALIYAFGARWGPERKRRDQYFGFKPGNGIHDVHMNQANSDAFKRDDGVWQDGGLFFQFPARQQWVAIFLKFQSQAWHSDDRTGHRIDVVEPEPDHLVRIVAAMVEPRGRSAKTVTLINRSPEPIDLSGWAIADSLKRKHPLSGPLEPGVARRLEVPSKLQLDPTGGVVTLLDARGLKVDGVSYTKEQSRGEGWTIVF